MGRPKLIGPHMLSVLILCDINSQESCADCGHDVYEDLDYHHKDPSTKITTVSDMVGRYGRKRILEEIDKCVVLCKTCHKTYH